MATTSLPAGMPGNIPQINPWDAMAAAKNNGKGYTNTNGTSQLSTSPTYDPLSAAKKPNTDNTKKKEDQKKGKNYDYNEQYIRSGHLINDATANNYANEIMNIFGEDTKRGDKWDSKLVDAKLDNMNLTEYRHIQAIAIPLYDYTIDANEKAHDKGNWTEGTVRLFGQLRVQKNGSFFDLLRMIVDHGRNKGNKQAVESSKELDSLLQQFQSHSWESNNNQLFSLIDSLDTAYNTFSKLNPKGQQAQQAKIALDTLNKRLDVILADYDERYAAAVYGDKEHGLTRDQYDFTEYVKTQQGGSIDPAYLQNVNIALDNMKMFYDAQDLREYGRKATDLDLYNQGE